MSCDLKNRNMVIDINFNSTIKENNKIKLIREWPQCKILELNKCNKPKTYKYFERIFRFLIVIKLVIKLLVVIKIEKN